MIPLISMMVVGCSSPTGFPVELAALEPNRAPPPDGEGVEIVSGGDDALWWAHAHGFLDAPLPTVWLHARDIEVCVDRREVSEYSVTPDTVPRFDASYTIHNQVRDVITVQYDTTWVHEVQQGTVAVPERVVAQWDKTAGTVFIELLAGSVEFEADGDGTRVLLVEHLRAPLRDDATIARYLEDYFWDLAARVDGDPLPVLTP